jgi:hypothetical protein
MATFELSPPTVGAMAVKSSAELCRRMPAHHRMSLLVETVDV